MVEQTSLLAYASFQNKLGAMQQAVYDTIEEFGPIADFDIAKRLRRDINTVTPRRGELIVKGFVTLHALGLNSLGNTAKLWVAKDPNDHNLIKIAKESAVEQDCAV